MNDESLVAILADHLIQKAVAGAAFLIEYAALAQAGVNQEAKRQGKIRLTGEVADGLRAAIFAENEVLFIQIIDDFAAFVADGGEHIDDFDIDGNGGRGVGGFRRWGGPLQGWAILGESEARPSQHDRVEV